MVIPGRGQDDTNGIATAWYRGIKDDHNMFKDGMIHRNCASAVQCLSVGG